MEITSNKMYENHNGTSMVLNSDKLNKYNTISYTGIKTKEQYFRLENELVELDCYQFKHLSVDNFAAYLLQKRQKFTV